MNAAEFREAMSKLPEPPDDSLPPHWNFWRRQLWQLGQSEDVNNFYKWPCIYHTMLTMHMPIGNQLLYLQQDWPRWEPIVSNRDNEADYRNMVNQCAHLKLWEDTTHTRIEWEESIVEFGGGYGAMALVCHMLGFTGRYSIVDLPEFQVLQKWYLGQHGIKVNHIESPEPSDLFIAIYSITEIPPSERDQWLRAESYLFLGSSQFDQWDNLAWLGETIITHPELYWYEEQFPNRPDYYAIGWPK